MGEREWEREKEKEKEETDRQRTVDREKGLREKRCTLHNRSVYSPVQYHLNVKFDHLSIITFFLS